MLVFFMIIVQELTSDDGKFPLSKAVLNKLSTLGFNKFLNRYCIPESFRSVFENKSLILNNGFDIQYPLVWYLRK